MSDIIRLLPDSVANQIAAGEVIQRPSSVIKELVENAVDAGATEIRVIVVDAGRTLIQVIDNGKGMTETDARMAFERHATSKISQAADLFTLTTMGFRGEALPSICAISQVELKTRRHEDTLGTRLLINASKVESQEPTMCEAGTNIMVKNLFFNVPARRKFLKSDNVELTNIMREFERLALVNNSVRLVIERNGKVVHDLRPASLKQRIADLWKNNLNMQLLPVDVDTELVKIEGFVSRPEHARRRNALQYLFVNGRHMLHPYFRKAILSCFQGLIPSDAQPNYFIRFTVHPDTIDVNIHPTKNEIKFENEQHIWPILVASVRAALGKYAAVPSIDFESEPLPLEPLPEGEKARSPKLDIPADYNPFERYTPRPTAPARHGSRGAAFRQSPPADWDSLYGKFMRQAAASTDAGQSLQPDDSLPFAESDASADASAVCVQFALKYIVAPSREGLLIIDQHRAHTKILYEQLMARSAADAPGTAQTVMFPETISLDARRQNMLEEVKPQLEAMGFGLEYLDDDRWQITSLPASPRIADPVAVISDMLDKMSDDSMAYGDNPLTAADLRSRIALTLAHASAIRRGVKLSPAEMEHLMSELFSLPSPALTPEGNPVYRILDERQIERFFS